MASRYWVGGTASWDGTAGTKWAATSGGAGGQSVPGSADDVFFDAASGAVTITQTTTPITVNSLNMTGFTGTFAASAIDRQFAVNLNLTVGAAANFTHIGEIIILGSATSTITSNGRTWGACQFRSSSSTGSAKPIVLADALNAPNALFEFESAGGTFNSGGFNVTVKDATFGGGWAFTLGGSTMTLTGATLRFNSGITSFAGPAALTLSGAGPLAIDSDATNWPHIPVLNISAAGYLKFNAISSGRNISVGTINPGPCEIIELDGPGDLAVRIDSIQGDPEKICMVRVDPSEGAYCEINGNALSHTWNGVVLENVHFINGTFVANNSYDLLNVTGITVNPPTYMKRPLFGGGILVA